MSVPVVEILNTVATRIGTVTVANGYSRDVKQVLKHRFLPIERFSLDVRSALVAIKFVERTIDRESVIASDGLYGYTFRYMLYVAAENITPDDFYQLIEDIEVAVYEPPIELEGKYYKLLDLRFVSEHVIMRGEWDEDTDSGKHRVMESNLFLNAWVDINPAFR